ncbi:MAG: P27 family phage terminase small subunit [Hoeflea sp.]|uniref:P27 family phage terminase small subunit n=1 Tax=Hoeflea sp. TaxID=1940281 RepID=UPI001DF1E3FB|nr:P27 family phage terminase small subunit [Hoeflea sp.]MBU4529779.1 P27 family phage terminase small subunit [Alphaproteobacteria bacterium]MBU4543340.1 P27 family phage terminase small subunit [Alphaproteobacteria bacterium]MBU4552527.1 P27 family phage terminase small subunit [Alphaproteobacteria bacterium]MBV1723543.1 P27 family phage terminase small subunit [Hoeflea sp.]MBV1762992.1 P27 family phage terminase small subunit [Hoeflea sp.]
MAAGRKPQLRAIEGGLSKIPPAPAGLNPTARAEWNRTCGELIDRSALAKSDLPTIEMYATCRAMVVKFRPLADKAEPFLVNEKTGAIKKHPAHIALTNYLTLCLRYESELGLTPAARNRKGFRDNGGNADASAPPGLDL